MVIVLENIEWNISHWIHKFIYISQSDFSWLTLSAQAESLKSYIMILTNYNKDFVTRTKAKDTEEEIPVAKYPCKFYGPLS